MNEAQVKLASLPCLNENRAPVSREEDVPTRVTCFLCMIILRLAYFPTPVSSPLHPIAAQSSAFILTNDEVGICALKNHIWKPFLLKFEIASTVILKQKLRRQSRNMFRDNQVSTFTALLLLNMIGEDGEA